MAQAAKPQTQTPAQTPKPATQAKPPVTAQPAQPRPRPVFTDFASI